MALIDPAEPSKPAAGDDTTRHPMLCLLGGFGFIVATAVLVHVAFTALF